MNDKLIQNTDGSYSWTCRIDKEYHRHNAIIGLGAVLVVVLVLVLVYAFLPTVPGQNKNLWIIIIPVAVILVIGIPLFYFQFMATEPCERYEMTDEYVKSGYARSAIFSVFKKIKYIEIKPGYFLLYDGRRKNRIYVPEESRDFVQEFILKRIPEGAEIRRL